MEGHILRATTVRSGKGNFLSPSFKEPKGQWERHGHVPKPETDRRSAPAKTGGFVDKAGVGVPAYYGGREAMDRVWRDRIAARLTASVRARRGASAGSDVGWRWPPSLLGLAAEEMQ
jgi:hypothetical protein